MGKEYGTKEYWENQLEESEIQRQIFLNSLKEQLNYDTRDDVIIDLIIDKLDHFNFLISQAKEYLSENKEV